MTSTEKLHQRIRNWRDRGYTHQMIADKVDRHIQTVNYVLNGHNWDIGSKNRKVGRPRTSRRAA